MKKSIVIYGSVPIAIIVAVVLLFGRQKNTTYHFRYDRVSQGSLAAYVTSTGTVNPVTSVDVGTQVSGIISKLYADFNSVVKQGQIIAQIDSTFLIQSVKDAEASLAKAKAQYAESKRNLDREKALVDSMLDSQLNYEAALTTYESNGADLKSAESALERAKINLAYATIYAPINGVIINRAVNVGQTVAASYSSPTLYTIGNDLRKMQVEATVDETDIGRVSIGQDATFTVDAYPDETFSGKVTQIRLAPQSIQNVVNYVVVIGVNNDQLKLMPGMTANVKILVASAQNVFRVSNMALRFQPSQDMIDATALQGKKKAVDAVSGKKMSDSTVASAKSHLEAPDVQIPQSPKMPGDAAFGITVTYPEYQKSAYVPSHDSGRGQMWIVGATGKLVPIFVRTGISDGRYTEVTSPELKADEPIVVGVNSDGESTAAQTSPLSGSSMRMGGGMR